MTEKIRIETFVDKTNPQHPRKEICVIGGEEELSVWVVDEKIRSISLYDKKYHNRAGIWEINKGNWALKTGEENNLGARLWTTGNAATCIHDGILSKSCVASHDPSGRLNGYDLMATAEGPCFDFAFDGDGEITWIGFGYNMKEGKYCGSSVFIRKAGEIEVKPGCVEDVQICKEVPMSKKAYLACLDSVRTGWLSK